MSVKRSSASKPKSRRRYTREFNEEAVQMLLDGHSAESVASRLGLSGTQCLYRWRNGNTTFVARIFIKLDARTRRE